MTILHATPDNWPEVLTTAEPGDTVVLAPGIYQSFGPVPEGVCIQGARIDGKACDG